MTKGLKRKRAEKRSVVTIVKSRTLSYSNMDFHSMVLDAIANLEAEGVEIPSSGIV